MAKYHYFTVFTCSINHSNMDMTRTFTTTMVLKTGDISLLGFNAMSTLVLRGKMWSEPKLTTLGVSFANIDPLTASLIVLCINHLSRITGLQELWIWSMLMNLFLYML